MKNDELASKVCDSIVSCYNKLPPKGKPTIRSNGAKEWTVLAGIAAVFEHENRIEPICLATGVKTLPEKTRKYSNGLMVHDLHAEILCLRLLNWFLLEECGKVRDDLSTICVEKLNESEFKIKDGIRFALYISEPPCGDASMEVMVNSLDNKEIWDVEEPPRKQRKLEQDTNNTSAELNILRGRNGLNKVGIVRTKPGRNDSMLSLSKSCSDKLCMKQLIGLTNSITSMIFPQGVYLNYLVIQRGKHNVKASERCFNERFIQKLNEPYLDRVVPLEILTYESDEYENHKSKDVSITSPLSLVYIVPTKTHQVLNNGVKEGGFSKGKPPKRGGQSFICNQELYKKAQSFLKHDCVSYHDIKSKNTERENLKCLGQEILGDWVHTGLDDFILPTNIP
ncbi:tRNA-specific adenosine deaminase 1 [[Candida] anglica]|uniref:tRNA-specific adenosine deaminase 1 n=1 Tax=[Candida] anglica TaxID=148631 RepID=A0ABP0EPG0_9ASCO